jgi:two-component system, NarL family, sensor kinase
MYYLFVSDIFKNPTTTLILGIIIFILLFVFFWTFLIVYFKRLNAMRLAQEKLQAEIANEVNNARNEIQQATLNNISQEIHDNVGQILSLTKMQLNLIEAQEVKDNNLISEAKDNISKAMTDLRDLAKGMSSDRIQLLGLYDSVFQEAVRINKVGRLQVQVSSNGTKKEPDHKKQLVVFRVIQECFQNIIKHAQANHVLVTFTYQLDSFDVLIKDDGIGFEYHPGSPVSEGLGLMNIFNRIHLVGGEVTLNSAPGVGTTVKLTVPL